ncbi:hypothetical protein HN51_043423 [Arachis hypogaea]
MLRFPPVRSRVGLGEHPSDCLRGSKRAHKAHNKNKTNRDFIRDHLSCRSHLLETCQAVEERCQGNQCSQLKQGLKPSKNLSALFFLSSGVNRTSKWNS